MEKNAVEVESSRLVNEEKKATREKEENPLMEKFLQKLKLVGS